MDKQVASGVVEGPLYDTDNLEIAAFLKATKHEPDSFRRVNGRMHFYFRNQQVCTQLQQDYLLRKGVVIALDYVDALNWARTIIKQA